MRVTQYCNLFIIYLVSEIAFTNVILTQDYAPPYENPKVTIVSDFFDWESIISDRFGYTITSLSTLDEGLISGILKHKINLVLNDTSIISEVVRNINISGYREDTNGNGIFDILEIDRSFVKTFTGTEVATFKDTQTNSSQGKVTADVQYLLKRNAGSIELEVTIIGKVTSSSVFGVFAGDELDALISYLDLSHSYGEILLDELQNTYELELNATTPEGIFSHLHTGELVRTSSDLLTLKNFPSIGKNHAITFSDLTLKGEGNNLTGQHRSGNYNYAVRTTSDLDSDRDGKSNLVDIELIDQIYVRTEQNSISYITKDLILFIDPENVLWRVSQDGKRKIADGTTSISVNIPLREVITLDDQSVWQFWNPINFQFHGDVLTELEELPEVKIIPEWGDSLIYNIGDDDLWGVGNNYFGQLGNGKKWSEDSNYYFEAEPIKIVDSGVVSAGTGWGYTLFSKENGTLWGMGQNPIFSFVNDLNESLFPVQLPEITDIKSVSVNSTVALLTKKDKSLWGLGTYEPFFADQVDFFDYSNDSQRFTIPYLLSSEPVSHIDIGGSITSFVKKDGSLWGFGHNTWGELGKNLDTLLLEPVEIIPSDVYSSHQNHDWQGNLGVVKTNGELWDLGFSEVWPNWEENASNHLIPNSRRVTSATIPSSDFIHISAKTDLDETLASSGTHETGSKITLSAPANEDREFSHWVIIPPQDDYYYHSEYSELEVFSTKQNLRIISGTDLELIAFYTDKDEDQDGLTNAQERQLGTNPESDDSDSDGLSDYDEVHNYGTDPSLSDSDGDGLIDFTEVSTGYDPLIENDKKRIQKLITLLKNENLSFVFPEGWFFTESKGWQWTSAQVYPWVYSNTEKGWLYFSVKSKKPFYSYKSKSWTNY